MSNETETFESISEWQKKTFPQARPLGALVHMRRELNEIEEAYKFGACEKVKEELADAYILWVGMCSRLGFDAPEIDRAVVKKMAKNRKRTWGKPDSDGVVEHVRGVED